MSGEDREMPDSEQKRKWIEALKAPVSRPSDPKCPECDGTGRFYMTPVDWMKCVVCDGTPPNKPDAVQEARRLAARIALGEPDRADCLLALVALVERVAGDAMQTRASAGGAVQAYREKAAAAEAERNSARADAERLRAGAHINCAVCAQPMTSGCCSECLLKREGLYGR